MSTVSRRNFLQGSLGLLAAGVIPRALAAAVPVAGFTTADILTAAVAAGAGGTVLFPNGTYVADGLQVLIPDQTWLLDRYAVLQKPATASQAVLLENKVMGFRLRGGALKDTVSNTTPHGISSLTGTSLDLKGTKLIDVRGWGVWCTDAPLAMDDVEVTDSKYGSVLWTATSNRRGPTIDRVRVRRTDLAKYASSGGIHVIGNSESAWNTGTRIANCVVELPVGYAPPYENSVGIENWYGEGSTIIGNEVRNGRIAYSLYRCQFFKGLGNYAMAPADYAYELAYCSFGDWSHNTARGWGPGVNWHIELNNGTNYCNLTENKSVGFAQDVHGALLNNTYR